MNENLDEGTKSSALAVRGSGHDLVASTEILRGMMHAVLLDGDRSHYLVAEDHLFDMESRFGLDAVVHALDEMPDYDLSCAANLVEFSMGDALPTLLSTEKVTSMLAHAGENSLEVPHLLQSVLLNRNIADRADFCMELVGQSLANEEALETLLGMFSVIPFRSEEGLMQSLRQWDDPHGRGDMETLLEDDESIALFILAAILHNDEDLFMRILNCLIDPRTGKKIPMAAGFPADKAIGQATSGALLETKVPGGEGDWL